VIRHLRRHGPIVAAGVGLAATIGACAGRPLRLPSGSGVPLPDAVTVFTEAAAPCRGVRTLQAELSISGRVGSQRLRGRVLAGFERPSAMRLEGMAPFGPPAFILVARDGAATLLLPRDDRVLESASPAAVIEALAGVPVAADDLRAILAGCVVDDPAPAGARAYAGGWAAADLDAETTVYLRQQPRGWRIVAGTIGRLTVEYRQTGGPVPGETRLRLADAGGAITTDLTVVLSQVETNGPIDPRAFSLVRPPTAVPMTVDELRQSGPLGGPR